MESKFRVISSEEILSVLKDNEDLRSLPQDLLKIISDLSYTNEQVTFFLKYCEQKALNNKEVSEFISFLISDQITDQDIKEGFLLACESGNEKVIFNILDRSPDHLWKSIYIEGCFLLISFEHWNIIKNLLNSSYYIGTYLKYNINNVLKIALTRTSKFFESILSFKNTLLTKRDNSFEDLFLNLEKSLCGEEKLNEITKQIDDLNLKLSKVEHSKILNFCIEKMILNQNWKLVEYFRQKYNIKFNVFDNSYSTFTIKNPPLWFVKEYFKDNSDLSIFFKIFTDFSKEVVLFLLNIPMNETNKSFIEQSINKYN